MNSDGQAKLAGIASARARIGRWPIPTTAMSPTSRGLHFDVREGSHGVELIVPACDRHAVMVPWPIEAIHRAKGTGRAARFPAGQEILLSSLPAVQLG
jgi:hypothetical protein